MFDLERWTKREEDMGKEFVAHKGLKNYDIQKFEVERIIDQWFILVNDSQGVFSNVCDFGCGSGRFVKALKAIANNYHGVDILPGNIIEPYLHDETDCATYANFPTDGISSLNIEDDFFDLFFSCTVLQHIVSDEDFEFACKEIKRITKDNCKFLMIETASDKAPHVIDRTPSDYARVLGFKLGTNRLVHIDKPSSHWVFSGTKE